MCVRVYVGVGVRECMWVWVCMYVYMCAVFHIIACNGSGLCLS